MNYTVGGQPVRFMVRMSPDNAKFMLIPVQMTNYIRGLGERATIRRKNTFLINKVTVRRHEPTEGNKLIIFGKGWQGCRLQNNANHGDDVLFEYAGNSVFTITVLSGADGTPKEFHGSPPPVERGPRCGPPPRADGSGESDALADCFLANSSLPNFKVMLTSSYMQRGIVNIPFQFACDNFPDGDNMKATIKIRGLSREVTMAFYYRHGGRPYNCKISSGFKSIIEAANLQEGQILGFELLRANPLKFTVTVFGPDL